jgi:hypothetical protein
LNPKNVGPKSTSMTIVIGEAMRASHSAAASMNACLAVGFAWSAEVARSMIDMPLAPFGRGGEMTRRSAVSRLSIETISSSDASVHTACPST